MNSSKDSIIIQNIVKCSADLYVSSAEIDLLIAELFDNIAFSQRSVWDIKNEVLQKYEHLQKAYNKKRQQYDVLKERLIISKYISEKFKSYTEIDQSIFKKPKFVNIAYWYSNNYAKEAAESFAKMFESCNKIQAESFAEVCELISDDITLGVVPVANSNDGRLISFYRLLDKYDLKISATHNVEMPNGNGFSRFALVGKRIHNLGVNENKNLEFTVIGSLSSIVYIAEFVGGTVKEVTSIPSPHSDNECLNYITITVNEHKIFWLWWFLYIFGGNVEFIGVYTEN